MKTPSAYVLSFLRSIPIQIGMYFSRSSNRPVPLREVIDLAKHCALDPHDEVCREELEAWMQQGVVHFRPAAPAPAPDLTPRRVALWLADQAGADHRRRTKILRAFAAVRRAWPES